MKPKYYDGMVRERNGKSRTVRLRETINFWMESKELWWRKTDGTPSGTGPEHKFPKLILSSLKPFEEVRGSNRKTTHKARVKNPHKGGSPAFRGVRLIKFGWVDGDGNLFRFNDNLFAKNGERLLVDTIVPHELFKQPRKPRA